jgi:enamine deaminase RidA (YjgF/YER057c/UK114 family)
MGVGNFQLHRGEAKDDLERRDQCDSACKKGNRQALGKSGHGSSVAHSRVARNALDRPGPAVLSAAPMSAIDSRLAELGITLPQAAAPVAAYVPTVLTGDLLHISGQVSMENGERMVGRLGEDRDLEYGQRAARACGLMLLAQMKKALGSLDRVERIVKLGVFVNSAADFTAQPQVANGASELMAEVFGEAGRHARSAVGVPVLPLGVAVEIDAIVQIR